MVSLGQDLSPYGDHNESMDPKWDSPSVGHVIQCKLPCLHNSNSASMHLNHPDSETIDDIYDQFGPTPRLCILKPLNDHQLEEYKNNTRIALENLTLQSLQELIRNTEELKMDKVSHKLCLISRKKLHNVRSSFCVHQETGPRP